MAMKLGIVAAILSALFLFGGYHLMSQIDEQRKITKFTLNNADVTWTFPDQASEINLIYFGYTLCPDLCPMTSANVAKAVKKLSPKNQKRVNFIFVNVDTRMENPSEVATYVRQFNKKFIGLSGTKQQIDQVIQRVGAAYLIEDKPDTNLGYSVAHPDRLYIINKNGIILGSVSGPESYKPILKKLKEFL